MALVDGPGNDKPVSLLEEGGSNRSAGIGVGSAAIELRSNVTDPASDSIEIRVPTVNKSNKSYITGSQSASASGQFSTGVGADIECQHVASTECARR